METLFLLVHTEADGSLAKSALESLQAVQTLASGLGELAKTMPEIRGQLSAMTQRLSAMSPAERYSAIHQTALSSLSTKDALDQLHSHIKQVVLPDGTVLGVDQRRGTAEVLYQGQPKPIVASPGSQLFQQTPDGGVKQVASVPARDTTLEAKINEMVLNGIPRAAASNIATGVWTVSRDPVTNEVTVVDKASGQPVSYAASSIGGPGTPSPIANALQGGQSAGAPAQNSLTGAPSAPAVSPSAAPAPGIDLYNRQSSATGVVPALQELATNVVPQAAQVLPQKVLDTARKVPVLGQFVQGFPDVVTARQELTAAQNELIRSLSINPRFPVGEITRIRREIDLEPSMLTSPDAMRAKMRGIDTYLRGRLRNEQSAALDPKLPPDQRKEALQASRAISNFLRLLNVPQKGQEDKTQGSAAAPVSDGVTLNDVEAEILRRARERRNAQ